MKVAVLGLWHLGTVTAACLAAAGHEVTGVDFDRALVDGLVDGMPPLFEPGLEDLVRSGLASGRLRFTTDVGAAVGPADVVWIAFDTPVDDEDNADVEWVVERAVRIFPHVRDGAVVLISSQLPVGSTRRLEDSFGAVAGTRRAGFACSPENLRLGKAIEAFTHPDRVVVGVRSNADRPPLERLLASIAPRVEWMTVESAEMTKHALNGFLAMSVAFINEIAALCEQVGADATDVARGLKSDARIGPRAYLAPGAAFAGGTLARDVMFLSQLGRRAGVATHLVSSVKTSNDEHRLWAQRRLSDVLGVVAGATIAIWGLTYKPGTDTLRRSSAVELCVWLHDRGARVRAHDPAVRQLPAELRVHLELAADPLDAATGAAALVVATPWPDYKEVDGHEVARRMLGTLVLDPNRFLAGIFEQQPGLVYLSVGKGTSS
jgi:UDPglucose 6-dehydrogenase